jgi:DNA-binding beta-propeller fold protein YncE
MASASAVTTAAVATSVRMERANAQAPVMLGTGAHTYEWIADWAQLPGGADFGNTHGGIAVDSFERVYVNTDTEEAVMIFDADGRFLKSWGQEFAGGLHGMTLVRNCAEETMFLTHTARHEVVQTTLDGDVINTLAFPEMSGVYGNAAEYQPTGVAVAPDGSVFIGDGYGRSWIHKYDANGAYVRSFGGGGNAPGQFNTPHGLMVDTRGATPQVIIADRENGRLQIFDLDGELIDRVEGLFRRPCGVHVHGTDLVVPDLAGRVTILDANNELITHLGDNPNPDLRAQNGVDKNLWEDGYFLSPHSAAFDDDGNLYVMDWNFRGRITKLRRMR